MSDREQDQLWPHFVPLWSDLRKVDPTIVLAGGYGLFLKQRWLQAQVIPLRNDDGDTVTTVDGDSIQVRMIDSLVPLDRWLAQEPRVTKDLDFVAQINLIADSNMQQQIDQALNDHRYAVVEDNARWQFKKSLDEKIVIVEFHAAPPATLSPGLRIDERRVRPNPSLHMGIHGRNNPEAAGCNLRPFQFTLETTRVSVPNPVTWSMMKLTAMRDRFIRAQDENSTPENREKAQFQAIKHAQDVCRILGLMTRDESDKVPSIVATLQSLPIFSNTKLIAGEFFGKEDGSGRRSASAQWRQEDLSILCETLVEWFK